MIHSKRHWYYKSPMTPQANKLVVFTYSVQLYQDQEIFRTSWGISIFRSSTNICTRKLWDKNLFPPNCSVCVVQSKQKNGRKCEKRSTTNTRNYYVTLAVCTFKIACNALACNNFEFTFQLMTVALLNTKGFQHLKYCIRSKGFLEHLEAFLYSTVHEIFMLGSLSSYRYQRCQVAPGPDLDVVGPGAQAWWEAPCADTKCLDKDDRWSHQYFHISLIFMT